MAVGPDGFVLSRVLNPNDPTIQPGGASTREPWFYRVHETFWGGPEMIWDLKVDSNLGDGAVLDLAKERRIHEEVTVPASWFPDHYENGQPQYQPFIAKRHQADMWKL